MVATPNNSGWLKLKLIGKDCKKISPVNGQPNGKCGSVSINVKWYTYIDGFYIDILMIDGVCNENINPV